MAFVDASFLELSVKDRHDAEAYAKITNDVLLGVAKKNKGSAVTFVDEKVQKMIVEFYKTFLEGPDGSKEISDKVLALIAKSRADRKKAADEAKNVNAAGTKKAGSSAPAAGAQFNERGSKGASTYENADDYEDYGDDYYEEEEEEEEAPKPVVVQKSLTEIEKEKQAAAAAIVMPKKSGPKILKL